MQPQSSLAAGRSGLAQEPQSQTIGSEYAAKLNALQEQIDDLRMQQSHLVQTGAQGAESKVSGPSPPVQEAAWFAQQGSPSTAAPAPPQYPVVKLTGFFQADAVWFDQDATNIAVVGNVQDGADFRRARLAAVGDAWDNFSDSLEMNFAFPGRPSFMDVWLDGRLNDVTGGVNWYLNRFTKFQFNYIHAMLARPVGTDSDADTYAVRAQLDF